MAQDFSFINSLDYGKTGKPLQEQDIVATQTALKEMNFPQLPQDVIAFLKIYNGFRTEGRTIFGIDSQKHFFYDILGENLNAELEDASDILLLGETDMTWIGWVVSKNSYAIIDKDMHCVLHGLDSFTNAVRYVLQIDD